MAPVDITLSMSPLNVPLMMLCMRQLSEMKYVDSYTHSKILASNTLSNYPHVQDTVTQLDTIISTLKLCQSIDMSSHTSR